MNTSSRPAISACTSSFTHATCAPPRLLQAEATYMQLLQANVTPVCAVIAAPHPALPSLPPNTSTFWPPAAPQIMVHLSNALASDAGEEVVSMACVLLSQAVSVTSQRWDQVNAEAHEHSTCPPAEHLPPFPVSAQHTTRLATTVKRALLTAFASGHSLRVKRRLVDVIAKVAARRTAWPDLLPTMMAALRSGDAPHIEAGFFLMHKLCEFIGEAMKQHAGELVPMLAAGLEHAQPGVALAAVQASASFLSSLSEASERATFQPIVPALLKVVNSLLAAGQETQATEALQALVELVRVNPAMLSNAVAQVGNAMIPIAGSADVDESVRGLALELVVSVSEALSQTVGRSADFLGQALQLCLSLAVQVEEDGAEWAAASFNLEEDRSGDADTASLSYAGEQAFGRVTTAVGGPACVEAVRQLHGLLAGGANQGTWQARRAGLFCLGLLAASVPKAMRAHLDAATQLIIPFFNDSEPRVWHAAVSALAFLGATYATKGLFILRHGDRVLPLIAKVATPNPQVPLRVSAHAALSLVDLLVPEHCSGEVEEKVEGSLRALLLACAALLQSPSLSAITAGIRAITRLAAVVGDSFEQYYDDFVPMLVTVVTSPPTPPGATAADLAALQESSLECVAQVGDAVGLDRFRSDAERLLQLLLPAAVGGASDASLARQALTTLPKLATIIGAEFRPFLPRVLSGVLAVAASEPYVNVQAAGAPGSSPEAGVDSMTVDIRGVGATRLSLNTSEVQDKQDALRALLLYAGALGPAIAEHAEAILSVTIPAIPYKWYPGVRQQAAFATAKVVSAQFGAARQGVADAATAVNAMQVAFKQLLPMLQTERDVETAGAFMESVSDILGSALCGGDLEADDTPLFDATSSTPFYAVDLSGANDLVKYITQTWVASISRRMAALRNVKDESEATLDALEDVLDNEAELSRHCVDAIGYMIKMHRDAILPAWTEHVWKVVKPVLADPEAADDMRFDAVCTADDVLDLCGAVPDDVVAGLASAVPVGAQSEDPRLKQSSLFGAGVLAQKKPALLASPGFQASMDLLLRGILTTLRAPGAKDEDNLWITENAVSTLGKLLKHVAPAAAGVGLLGGATADLGKMWVRALPITEDEAEARWCHAALADALASNNAAMYGGDADAALAALAGALCVQSERPGYMLDASVAQAGQIFASLQSTNPAALSGLTEAQKAAVVAAVQRAA